MCLTCSALHSFKGLLSQFSTGLGCVGSVQHQVKHTLLKGGRGIFKVVENPKSQQHPCERIVVSESCEYLDQNDRRMCTFVPCREIKFRTFRPNLRKAQVEIQEKNNQLSAYRNTSISPSAQLGFARSLRYFYSLLPLMTRGNCYWKD